MDELSEDDKIIVARARRIERFLSQPTFVAEAFTGQPGRYVPVRRLYAASKRSSKAKYDHLPENRFLHGWHHRRGSKTGQRPLRGECLMAAFRFEVVIPEGIVVQQEVEYCFSTRYGR